MQFGFKGKHCASLAMSMVLETVVYHCSNGCVVYGLAVDATKAPARVMYDKLFNLLMTRKSNPLYIRILHNMYLNQKLKVSYNGVTCRCFSVSNGVKQGGVLSSTLQAVYVRKTYGIWV